MVEGHAPKCLIPRITSRSQSLSRLPSNCAVVDCSAGYDSCILSVQDNAVLVVDKAKAGYDDILCTH